MREILGKAKTVRELLSGSKYSIDYYQREYRWESKQISELITDLTSRFLEDYDPQHSRKKVESYGYYFLGSIILSRKDNLNFIVDGQQRLTSLTLLLIYLTQLQQGRPEDDQVKLDDLIYSAKYGQKSFNISVDEREPCMAALFEGQEFDIDGQPEAVANIVARYEDIGDQFPEELQGAALPYFIDWITENVQLVEITAFSDDDAYTIFETMNDRGLSLSPIDMLKGYLLANIDDAESRAACNLLWKQRVQDLSVLGKDADADCFKSWLRSQYAKTIRERKRDAEPGDFDRIGSEFHRWVRDMRDTVGVASADDFTRFIQRDFKYFSKRYLEVVRAGDAMTPGLEHVFYNAQAGFTLQPMLLLAPLTPDDDEVAVRAKWRLAARYLDIVLTRRAWNYRSTDQSTMKYPIFRTMLTIRHLEPPQLAEMLKADLDVEKEVIADNDRFALNGGNRRQILRILARMAEYIETASDFPSHYLEHTTSRGTKRYEVEHVWADDFKAHASEFQHESDFAAYRNRLGGLLLLPKTFNASYQDITYEEKLPHYFGQNLLARSLHADCYSHHPGFRRFVKQSELPFHDHAQFQKADLDERGVLYRKIAERIWDPQLLLSEIE